MSLGCASSAPAEDREVAASEPALGQAHLEGVALFACRLTERPAAGTSVVLYSADRVEPLGATKADRDGSFAITNPSVSPPAGRLLVEINGERAYVPDGDEKAWFVRIRLPCPEEGEGSVAAEFSELPEAPRTTPGLVPDKEPASTIDERAKEPRPITIHEKGGP